jgi:hypothetical protein
MIRHTAQSNWCGGWNIMAADSSCTESYDKTNFLHFRTKTAVTLGTNYNINNITI